MIRQPGFLDRCVKRQASRALPASFLVAALALVARPVSVLQAQTSGSTPGAVRSYSTITSIGVEWDIVGDANHNASATVEYRVSGTGAWRTALPLVRVDYNGANMLAGSVPFLAAGTSYDVRLTLADPDGGAAVQTVVVTTRRVPARPSSGRRSPSSRTSSPRPCRWPPTSRRAARARRAPAPTSSTPATSRRWRRGPISARPRRFRSVRFRSKEPKDDNRRATKAPDAMTRKVVHDASAYIRGLAQLRGRNAEWAERAVREAVSLSADEALKQKVIDVVAADVPQLLRAPRRKQGLRFERQENHARDARRRDRRVRARLAHALPRHHHRSDASPTCCCCSASTRIIFEFTNPGLVAPGVAGAVCAADRRCTRCTCCR